MEDSARLTAQRVGKPAEKPRIPSFMFTSAIGAIPLTALFYLLLHISGRGTYIWTIFVERGSIPYMTTYLAFAALVQLAGLFWHLRRESRNLRAFGRMFDNVTTIETRTVAALSAEVNGCIHASDQTGLVVSRVRRVLHRVENKGSSGDVAALLTEQAEIDRAILSNGYSAVRFIAWLIPVLGFIGTVLGISLAIAQFPALFASKGSDNARLLDPITQNLGVAFDTTLIALAQIAIVMFVLYEVQKRGSELLNKFDEFCLDNLLGKVRGGGVPEDVLPAPFSDIAKVLAGHVENMEQKFEQAVGHVVSRLIENEQERWQCMTNSFRAAAEEHHTVIKATCDAVADESKKLGQELRNWVPQFRDSLKTMVLEIREMEVQRIKAIADTIETASGRISNTLAMGAEQSNAACDRMLAGQEKVGASVANAAHQLDELLKKQAVELRQMESQHMEKLGRLLESTAARVGGTVAEAVIQSGATCDRMVVAQEKAGVELRAALGQIEALLRTSEELASIQQTLHSNLAALAHTGEMRQTVERLNGSIERLSPVLIDLQRRRRMQVKILDEVEENGSQTA